MKDRQPTRPGRVKITPENGAAYYAVMEMADEPTEVGTPPTKANLLKDTTASLLGGGADMVPDDALVALKTLIDGISAESIGAAKIASGSYTGTGKYGASNKNTLTFPFVPKMVYITEHGGITGGQNVDPEVREAIVLYGMTSQATYIRLNGPSAELCTFEWNGNTVSWYNQRSQFSADQFNNSSKTYDWIAFG